MPDVSNTQEVTIPFELVEEEQANDPALVSAIGRDTIEALQHTGYSVRPVYIGQQGGAFLVEVVTTVTHLATLAWDYRAVAEEVVNDLSSLVTIFSVVVPLLTKMLHSHEQRVGKEESVSNSVKIALEIDGTPFVIEAPDVTQAEAALTLAMQFRDAHPTVAAQVTTKSKVKVQGRVPARKRRRRR